MNRTPCSLCSESQYSTATFPTHNAHQGEKLAAHHYTWYEMRQAVFFFLTFVTHLMPMSNHAEPLTSHSLDSLWSLKHFSIIYRDKISKDEKCVRATDPKRKLNSSTGYLYQAQLICKTKPHFHMFTLGNCFPVSDED